MPPALPPSCPSRLSCTRPPPTFCPSAFRRGAGSLDVEGACRGFLDTAKLGAAACVAAVYADPAFADLFLSLYCT